MLHRISRSEIQTHIESRMPMTLVEALPEKYYRDGHLPGAVHLPHDQVRALAGDRLPDKGAFIVVYCASEPCQNSQIVAHTLEAMGYTNVAEYVEGKKDWIEAGLALDKSGEKVP